MATAFKLSDQQLKFFETFGFLRFPGMLASQVAEISDAFEQVFRSRGGGHDGKPHDGKTRSCIVPFIDSSERLSALLDDDGIHGVLCGLLGDDFTYTGSDGNFYVGDTGWHSDYWSKDHRYVKIAIYLDELTGDTGALRVLPGSHRIGEGYAMTLNESARKEQELWGIAARDVPALALSTKPGDVLAFDMRTKHASFGGSTSRRMFTINACQHYPPERVQELKDFIGLHARFWLDRIYGPAMLASATPRRMRHLEQGLANDGHLAELSRKAQETMKEPARG